MPTSSPADKIAVLYRRGKAGDGEAIREMVAMQREGRGLRYYPDGRQCPEDEGMGAFRAALVWHEGRHQYKFESGRRLNCFLISEEVAKKLIQAIESIPVRRPVMETPNLQVTSYNGDVAVVMPEEANEWYLSVMEAFGFADLLFKELLKMAAAKGNGAVEKLMCEIEGEDEEA